MKIQKTKAKSTDLNKKENENLIGNSDSEFSRDLGDEVEKNIKYSNT